MKKNTRTLFIALSLMTSLTFAYAEEEKCDSTMHNQKHTVMSGNFFDEADTNHDGAVTKKEFNAFYAKHNAKHFNELDKNHDGKITLDEMQSDSPKPEVTSNGATSHLDSRFTAADLNHDGGLDRNEAVNMPMLSKYFNEVDSNHDGKVTRQEYFDAMPILHGAKNIPMSGVPQSM